MMDRQTRRTFLGTAAAGAFFIPARTLYGQELPRKQLRLAMVGAGGIGSFAINYGQNLHHQDIVNVCVVVLLIFVSLIQGLGNYLSHRTTNRSLFQHKVETK